MKFTTYKSVFSAFATLLLISTFFSVESKSNLGKLKVREDILFKNGFPKDKLLEVTLGVGSVILSDDYQLAFRKNLANHQKACGAKIDGGKDEEYKNKEKEFFSNEAEELITKYLVEETKMKFPEYRKRGCGIFDDISAWVQKTHKDKHNEHYKRNKAICEEYMKNEEKATKIQTYEGIMKVDKTQEDILSGIYDIVKHSKRYLINTTKCIFDKKADILKNHLATIEKAFGDRIQKTSRNLVQRALAGGVAGGIKISYFKSQIDYNLYLAYLGKEAKTEKFYRLGKIAAYIMKLIVEIASKERRVFASKGKNKTKS